jgi:hypothetical protein
MGQHNWLDVVRVQHWRRDGTGFKILVHWQNVRKITIGVGDKENMWVRTIEG